MVAKRRKTGCSFLSLMVPVCATTALSTPIENRSLHNPAIKTGNFPALLQDPKYRIDIETVVSFRRFGDLCVIHS